MAEVSKYLVLEESIAKLLANIRREPDNGSAESKATLTLGFILGLEAKTAAEGAKGIQKTAEPATA